MTSLPFLTVLDKAVLLVSSEISDTLMMGLGSLLTWLVLFDSSSEYTSNTLTERPLSPTLVELRSLNKYELEEWRFSFGDSFSFISFFSSFVSRFVGVHRISSLKVTRRVSRGRRRLLFLPMLNPAKQNKNAYKNTSPYWSSTKDFGSHRSLILQACTLVGNKINDRHGFALVRGSVMTSKEKTNCLPWSWVRDQS